MLDFRPHYPAVMTDQAKEKILLNQLKVLEFGES